MASDGGRGVGRRGQSQEDPLSSPPGLWGQWQTQVYILEPHHFLLFFKKGSFKHNSKVILGTTPSER